MKNNNSEDYRYQGHALVSKVTEVITTQQWFAKFIYKDLRAELVICEPDQLH